MALPAYRQLLRATRIAFQGDQHLMHAARAQARVGFEKLSTADSSSKEVTDAIAHAKGVAEVLRHNIVQGVQAADGQTMSANSHENDRLTLTEHRTTHARRHRERRQRYREEPTCARRQGQNWGSVNNSVCSKPVS